MWAAAPTHEGGRRLDRPLGDSYSTGAMSKRTLGLVLVAIWVLLGPIAMAFDGCAGCELPCAQMACALVSPVVTPAPELVTSAALPLDHHPATSTVATPELPPKHILSAA